MTTLILSLLGMIPSFIDNFFQFFNKRKEGGGKGRLYYSLALLVFLLGIILIWCDRENSIDLVKEKIGFFLSKEDLSTKLKSETEIIEYLLFELEFDKSYCLEALLDMKRNGEIDFVIKEAFCEELEQELEIRYYFLTRAYTGSYE